MPRTPIKARTISTLIVLLAFCTPASIQRPSRPDASHRASCGGLHAGIRAVLQRRDVPYTHASFLAISFILVNDSQEAIDSAPRTWKILINGSELPDSGLIFGNGPAPIGGYGKLNPGDFYELEKAFDISQYFPKNRVYSVSWRGKGFQSSIIDVTLTADQR